MRARAWGVLLAACLGTALHGQSREPTRSQVTPAGPADTNLFRVFLKDGRTLVSYGEVARVEDQLVFSMPVNPSSAESDLQLVNLPVDRVDMDRTSRYAESVHASRYVATRAATDYALVSNDVAQALNAVAGAPDPMKRLAIVERARKTLADWPAAHYNYKQDEIKQTLAMLDEAIAELRVAAGSTRFDLTLVSASAEPPPLEPLMPAPTAQEAIAELVNAADLAESAPERVSLWDAALTSLQRDADTLAPEWAAATTAAVSAKITRERTTDAAYQALTTSTLTQAKARARTADVRGLQQLLDLIHARDRALGAKRPEAVAALVDSVQVELDAARRLQLARDQWALRVPAYRQYRASIASSVSRFADLKKPLEDIKALAGSSPFALSSVEVAVAVIRANLAVASPPEELKEVSSLLVSAAELADRAAVVRREAALTTSMTRAWDASAAAAGSLMLAARALDELKAALEMPQLPK